MWFIGAFVLLAIAFVFGADRRVRPGWLTLLAIIAAVMLDIGITKLFLN